MDGKNQTNTNLKETTEEAVNKKFFDETVRSHLSEEDIQKKLGGLKEEWKDDRIEEVLKEGDKEKLTTYKKLKINKLPSDWEAQLERRKELEKKLSDYTQIKEELKGWTDTFLEKKPNEVQAKIQQLEEELKDLSKKTEEEKTELQNKYNSTAAELRTWKEEFPEQNSSNAKRKISELEEELKEWKQTWNGQELTEIKEEWEELKKKTRYCCYWKRVLWWLCPSKNSCC